MITEARFSKETTKAAACIVAAISSVSSFCLNAALARGDLSRLYKDILIAFGIGLILGGLYYLLMKKILPQFGKEQECELWDGLIWFNLSSLSLWCVILPYPSAYLDFAIGFAFSGGCARLIGAVYTVFGSSLSNRKQFANTFVMLALTIMLVISVVKSSLALSLGLVGALSIIRFRTAIKEPEELAFLFFTVAIGLGFGAGKLGITLCAFFAISLGYILFRRLQSSSQFSNAYLMTFYGEEPDFVDKVRCFFEISEIPYSINRLEVAEKSKQVSFMVEVNRTARLMEIEKWVARECSGVNVSIVQARMLG